jgi:hypothetical protein
MLFFLLEENVVTVHLTYGQGKLARERSQHFAWQKRKKADGGCQNILTPDL